jgi:uncharacterized protein YbjQ (UPF0145 family)
MINRTLCALALAALAVTTTAQANDRKVLVPIAGAMASNDAQDRLGNSVRFYFGAQKSPAVVNKLDSDHTSQKTNAFGKSDVKACSWAFLSAMLQLQKHAMAVGANAVVNIVSNYKNVEFASETEFECHAGAVMAGVALKGDFVRVAD